MIEFRHRFENIKAAFSTLCLLRRPLYAAVLCVIFLVLTWRRSVTPLLTWLMLFLQSALYRWSATRSIALFVALSSVGVAQQALAQMPLPHPIDPTTTVVGTPLPDSTAASSPASVEAASAVKAEVPDNVDPDSPAGRQKVLNARTEANDYQFGVKQHDCYSSFFVNHCLDKARAERRVVTTDIRREQLALDDQQRLQHAQQRDQQTALNRAQSDADAPNRAAKETASTNAFDEKQKQNAISEAQRTAEAPQRAKNQAAYDQKQADYQKRLSDAAAQGAQDERNRELKAERFDAKQKDAAVHQADVAARQKQAAENQQQKAAQAATDAKHQADLKQQQQQPQPKQSQ